MFRLCSSHTHLQKFFRELKLVFCGIALLNGTLKLVFSLIYLHNLPLRALREDEDLVVERVERLAHGLRLLLGHTYTVLQEVHFYVRRLRKKR